MTHVGEDRSDEEAAAELPGERRAAALLDTLASTSCSAKIFRGKWAVIRGRLAGLASSLDSASPAGNTVTGASSSIGNLVLQELLDEISSTVEEARALSCACDGGSDSPPGGKLLLRSNLDLTIAKLDLHARSLAGLFSSGILAQPAARTTPTKPVRGAAREELRSYIRSLVSELRLGTSESKSRVLSALTESIQEDERYLGLLAVEEPEALSLLPCFLESRDAALQHVAAEAVSAIAGSDSHRAALARAGVVPPLVQVLQSGSPMGKESAARALRKLTERSTCAWSVAAAGGVTALLDACGGDDPAVGSELVVSACTVLRSLAEVAEIRSYMVEQGAVVVMLKRVRSAGGSVEGEGEEASLIQAMELLYTILSLGVEARAMALRAGGLEAFVRVMDPGSGFSTKARDVALRAGEALCLPPPPPHGKPPKAALAGSGLVDRVMLFLRSGELTVQGSRRKHDRDVVLGEDEDVGRILRVLDRGDEKPLSRKFLLSALASLTDSGSVSGKRKIASATTPSIGYSGDLADTISVSSNDGVRVVRRSFAANRFKSLLHGVWS